jgi:arylsulfatase
MVDDMGCSDLGCYGGEVRTPTLDALAGGGVRLARFYNCAQCSPSRASLMSGLYPHQAGVGDMNQQGVANEFWRRIGSDAYLGFKKEDVVTLPESLREAGYQTFMSGKWHLGQDESCWPDQRGFDGHFALIGGACEYFSGYRSWQKKGPITNFVFNGKKVEKLPHDFYTTDTFTDHTLRFIEEPDASRLWFGYLAYTAPHWPLQAYESDVAKYAETYRAGPDAIRQRRFGRLRELGLIPETARLPELDPAVTEEEKRQERGADHVTGVCLLGSVGGMSAVERAFSTRTVSVSIVASAVDGGLDASGFIIRGRGDAGGRLYGPCRAAVFEGCHRVLKPGAHAETAGRRGGVSAEDLPDHAAVHVCEAEVSRSVAVG